jgi:hypothetical protein
MAPHITYRGPRSNLVQFNCSHNLNLKLDPSNPPNASVFIKYPSGCIVEHKADVHPNHFSWSAQTSLEEIGVYELQFTARTSDGTFVSGVECFELLSDDELYYDSSVGGPTTCREVRDLVKLLNGLE